MSERKEPIMDLAEVYALGGMDESEILEYEAYLQNHAEERQYVTELRDTTGMLALAARPAAPPTGMKGRILANVLGSAGTSESTNERPTPSLVEETNSLPGQGAQIRLEQARQTIEADEARRAVQERGDIGNPEAQASETAKPSNALNQTVRNDDTRHAHIQSSASTRTETAQRNARSKINRSLWAGAATIMAAAALFLAFYSSQLRGEMNDMRSDMTAMQQHASDMEQQLASVSQPAVGAQVDRTVALVGGEEDPNASGMAAMVQDDSGTRLVVQASDLPALNGSEAYQIWLIKDGQPINAGTFMSSDGNGALSYTMEPGDYDMVAITLEPDAEGDQPRGRMVLTGAISG